MAVPCQVLLLYCVVVVFFCPPCALTRELVFGEHVALWQRSVGLGFPWVGLSPQWFLWSPSSGCLGNCRPFDEEWASWVRRWPKWRRFPPLNLSLGFVALSAGDWPLLHPPIGPAPGVRGGCTAVGPIKRSPVREGSCQGGRGEALGSAGDCRRPQDRHSSAHADGAYHCWFPGWGCQGEDNTPEGADHSSGPFF